MFSPKFFVYLLLASAVFVSVAIIIPPVDMDVKLATYRAKDCPLHIVYIDTSGSE